VTGAQLSRPDSSGGQKVSEIAGLYQPFDDFYRQHRATIEVKKLRARTKEPRQRKPKPVRKKPRSRDVRSSEVEGVELLLRDPCAYCGEAGQVNDHIDPISRGGVNEFDNLTRACFRCNMAKNAIPLLRWLVRRALK
jgi:5-methylcytosine-specific restriction endonuclease McrA